MNASPASRDSAKPTRHASKKCPECMEYMPLNAQTCPSCKLPVGKINEHGMAARRTNWKAYTVAIAAWLFFFFYIWWAFIREP